MTKNINGESSRIYWVRVSVPVSNKTNERKRQTNKQMRKKGRRERDKERGGVERERKRERVCVCACVCERERRVLMLDSKGNIQEGKTYHIELRHQQGKQPLRNEQAPTQSNRQEELIIFQK